MATVCNTTIIIGDFNGQIGKVMNNERRLLGPYATGKRNNNGQRLIDFAQEHNLCVMNTFYKKKQTRKWTWIAPNGKIKNEIDFIMTNKPKLFMDVSVVNQLNFNTDHRMLRGRIHGIQVKPTRRNIQNIKQQGSLPVPDHILNDLKHVLHTKVRETTNIQEKYNILEKLIKETEHKNSQTKTHKDKIGREAKDLIMKRKILNQDKPKNKNEISNISKTINETIRKHRQKIRSERIQFHIENTGGVRKAFKELEDNTNWIPTIKDQKLKKSITKRSEILKSATNFYRNLYNDTTSVPITHLEYTEDEEEIPPIMENEITKAIHSQKNRKSPGEDGISNEILKGTVHIIKQYLLQLFNEILRNESIPTQWATSKIILLHKKGNRDDISNYRPISLMSNLYKIFSKIILDRIAKVLDENQPKEQAGFRSGFSTVDHIHTIKQVIEKFNEYNMPYYLAFVDYNKAFDSLKHEKIWEALANQGVHNKYIRLIKNIYQNMTAKVRTEKLGEQFEIKKGVRQGDPLSPKLFSATFEQIFRNLDWTDYGIKVNGALLNHLRFADDLILISDNSNHLQEMLEQLVTESHNVGLCMNVLKTKLMTNREKNPIRVNNSIIEYVSEYTYLGQIISPNNVNSKEVQNRINASWKKYWSLKEITKNPAIPLKLKSRTFNSCILPSMTYGCQTWALTKDNINKLETCQHNIERSMLGIKRQDKIKLQTIRGRTNTIDVTYTINKLKWKWAGHLIRNKKENWAKDATEWYPREGKRKRGRPFRRWEDDLRAAAGSLWKRKALDRVTWKNLGEAYAKKQSSQTLTVP